MARSKDFLTNGGGENVDTSTSNNSVYDTQQKASTHQMSTSPIQSKSATTQPQTSQKPGKYAYRGNVYSSYEAAKEAQKTYQNKVKTISALNEADLASVGYDFNQYNLLKQNGQLLSQISDNEMGFIQKRYLQAGTQSTYKNTARDQLLYSMGLPSSKDLNKYRQQYTTYMGSGGILDVYKDLSVEEYDYIKKKFGEDYHTGLGGGVVDSKGNPLKYGDTLLDTELQANGLPSASQMEVYHAQYLKEKADAETKKAEEDKKKAEDAKIQERIDRLYEDAYANVDMTALNDGDPSTYSERYTQAMQDALYQTLQLPAYSDLGEYLSERTRVPTQDDADYQGDDFNSPYYGQFDPTSSYNSDVEKAIAKNAKRGTADFIVSTEGMENYVARKTNEARNKQASERYEKIRTENMNIVNTPATSDAGKRAQWDALEEYLRVYGGDVPASAYTWYVGAINAGAPVDVAQKGVAAVEQWNNEANAENPAKRAQVQAALLGYSTFNGVTKTVESALATENRVTQHKSYEKRSSYNPDLYNAELNPDHTPGRTVTTKGAIYALMNGQKHGRLSDFDTSDYSATYNTLNSKTGGKSLLSFVTDSERGTFNYLYSTDPNKAMEYLDQLSFILEDRAINAASDSFSTGMVAGMSDQDVAKYAYDMQEYAIGRDIMNIDDNSPDAWMKDAWKKYSSYTDEQLQYMLDSHSTWKTAEKGNGSEPLEVGKIADEEDMENAADLANYDMEREINFVLNKRNEARFSSDYAGYFQTYNAEEGAKNTSVVTDTLKWNNGKYTDSNGVDSQYAGVVNDVGHELPQAHPDMENTGFTRNELASRDIASAMTQEERDQFNWLLVHKGAEVADRYFEGIKSKLDVRSSEEITERNKQWAKDNPFWATVLSNLAFPITGAEAVLGTVGNLLTGTELTRTQAAQWDFTNEWREGVSEDMSGLGSFAYNTFMSMLDSGAAAGMNMALPGLGEVTLATTAFSGALRSSIDRGLNPTQATMTATIAGLAEYVTEKIGLETLVEGVKSLGKGTIRSIGKEALVNTLKQSIYEASEEVSSDVINLFADTLINGDQSELNQSIDNYRRQGMSKEEAERLAWRDWWVDLGLSAAGGFLSGGVMAGGGNIGGVAMHHLTNYGLGEQRAAVGNERHINQFMEGRFAVNRIFGNETSSAVQEALGTKETLGVSQQIDGINKLFGDNADSSSYWYRYVYDAEGNVKLNQDERVALASTLAVNGATADSASLDAVFAKMQADRQSPSQRKAYTARGNIMTSAQLQEAQNQIDNSQARLRTAPQEAAATIAKLTNKKQDAVARFNGILNKISAFDNIENLTAEQLRQKTSLEHSLSSVMTEISNHQQSLDEFNARDTEAEVREARQNIQRNQERIDKHWASLAALAEHASSTSSVYNERMLANAQARLEQLGRAIDANLDGNNREELAQLQKQQVEAQSDFDKSQRAIENSNVDVADAMLAARQGNAESWMRQRSAVVSEAYQSQINATQAQARANANARNAQANQAQNATRDERTAEDELPPLEDERTSADTQQQATSSEQTAPAEQNTAPTSEASNSTTEGATEENTASESATEASQEVERTTYKIGKKIQQKFDRIAARFNCKIVWETREQIQGNGYYDPEHPNEIHLATDMLAKKGMSSEMAVAREFFVHEIVHYIANTKSYRQLANIAYEYYRRTLGTEGIQAGLQGIIDEEASYGKEVDVAYAEEEMTAQFAQEVLFEDEQALNWLARRDLGMVSDMLEWVRYLIKYGTARRGKNSAIKTLLIDAEYRMSRAIEERQYLDQAGIKSAYATEQTEAPAQTRAPETAETTQTENQAEQTQQNDERTQQNDEQVEAQPQQTNEAATEEQPASNVVDDETRSALRRLRPELADMLDSEAQEVGENSPVYSALYARLNSGASPLEAVLDVTGAYSDGGIYAVTYTTNSLNEQNAEPTVPADADVFEQPVDEFPREHAAEDAYHRHEEQQFRENEQAEIDRLYEETHPQEFDITDEQRLAIEYPQEVAEEEYHRHEEQQAEQQAVQEETPNSRLTEVEEIRQNAQQSIEEIDRRSRERFREIERGWVKDEIQGISDLWELRWDGNGRSTSVEDARQSRSNIRLALKEINPELANILDSEEFKVGNDSPVYNAIDSLEFDVAKGMYSPMAVATVISDAYANGGMDGVRSLYELREGYGVLGAYSARNVGSRVRNVDLEHNPQTTTETSEESVQYTPAEEISKSPVGGKTFTSISVGDSTRTAGRLGTSEQFKGEVEWANRAMSRSKSTLESIGNSPVYFGSLVNALYSGTYVFGASNAYRNARTVRDNYWDSHEEVDQSGVSQVNVVNSDSIDSNTPFLNDVLGFRFLTEDEAKEAGKYGENEIFRNEDSERSVKLTDKQKSRINRAVEEYVLPSFGGNRPIAICVDSTENYGELSRQILREVYGALPKVKFQTDQYNKGYLGESDEVMRSFMTGVNKEEWSHLKGFKPEIIITTPDSGDWHPKGYRLVDLTTNTKSKETASLPQNTFNTEVVPSAQEKIDSILTEPRRRSVRERIAQLFQRRHSHGREFGDYVKQKTKLSENATLEQTRVYYGYTANRNNPYFSQPNSFEKQYDYWVDNGRIRATKFNVGNLTTLYRDYAGIENSRVYLDASKIIDNMFNPKEKHEHPEMTDEVIKQIPDVLKNPILMLKTKDTEHPDRIVVISDVYAHVDKYGNGKVANAELPVIVVIQPNISQDGHQLNANVVTSAYTKNRSATSMQDLMDESEVLWRSSNEERTRDWESYSGLQLPSVSSTRGSVNSISPTQNTRQDLADIAQGKTIKSHSRGGEFKDYKPLDWSKSKIKQDDGTDYPMLYSGSASSGHTIFTADYADDGLSVAWLTNKEIVAQSYAREDSSQPLAMEFNPYFSRDTRSLKGNKASYFDVGKQYESDKKRNEAFYKWLNESPCYGELQMFVGEVESFNNLSDEAIGEWGESAYTFSYAIEQAIAMHDMLQRLATNHSDDDEEIFLDTFDEFSAAVDEMSDASFDDIVLQRGQYSYDDFLNGKVHLDGDSLSYHVSELTRFRTAVEDAIIDSGMFSTLREVDDGNKNTKLGFSSNYKGVATLYSDMEARWRLPTYTSNHGVYKLKAYAENPLVIEVNGAWSMIDYTLVPEEVADGLARLYGWNIGYSTRNVARVAYENGYDAVVFRNIYDNGVAKVSHEMADVVCVFDPYQVKSIYNAHPSTNPDIRHSRGMSMKDYAKKYGKHKQSDFAKKRDIITAKQTNPYNRVSQANQTLKEVESIQQYRRAAIDQQTLEEGMGVYDPVTLDRMREWGRSYIASAGGLTQAMRDLTRDMRNANFKNITQLISAANQVFYELGSEKPGLVSNTEYNKFVAEYIAMRSEWGRAGKAMQLVNDSPVGRRMYWERVVERMNENNREAIGQGIDKFFHKNYKDIQVPPHMYQMIEQAKTQEEINKAEYAITEYIGQNSPLTVAEAIRNWRYFAMLFNPVTHIRNLLGNLTMRGGVTAKDAIAAGMENVAVRMGWMNALDRTHAIVLQQDADTRDYIDKLYEQNADMIRSGGRDGFYQQMMNAKKRSPIKAVDFLMRLNTDLQTKNPKWQKFADMISLEGEDAIFLRASFRKAAAQYIAAQHLDVNKLTSQQRHEIVQYATQQAQEATYRDASKLADALNQFAKSGWVQQLLVDAVMPFKKTPINIAKRGFSYSPFGLARGLVNVARNAVANSKGEELKIPAGKVVDEIAQGLTGTALSMLGFFLAQAGIIRLSAGEGDKDDKFAQDVGHQSYSLEIGNLSIKIESLAPMTFPLFMGAALEKWRTQGGDSFTVSDFTDALLSISDPLMDMSFMASLNSVLETYDENQLKGVAVNALQSYASQYIPTIGAKLNNVINPTRRTTKSSAASPVGTTWDYWLRSSLSKLPGGSFALEPYVKTTGEVDTIDNFGEWTLNFMNNFVSPVNVKIMDTSNVNREISRLVAETGNTDYVPQNPAKYLSVGNERYNMTAAQYTRYSKEYNEATYAALTAVMSSPAYANLTDDQRIEMLEKAYKAAKKSVQDKYKVIAVTDGWDK